LFSSQCDRAAASAAINIVPVHINACNMTQCASVKGDALLEVRNDHIRVRIESAQNPKLWTASFAGFDLPLASPTERSYPVPSDVHLERKRALLDLRTMRRPVSRERSSAAVLPDLRG
jgi:hypothetical protein